MSLNARFIPFTAFINSAFLQPSSYKFNSTIVKECNHGLPICKDNVAGESFKDKPLQACGKQLQTKQIYSVGLKLTFTCPIPLLLTFPVFKIYGMHVCIIIFIPKPSTYIRVADKRNQQGS